VSLLWFRIFSVLMKSGSLECSLISLPSLSITIHGGQYSTIVVFLARSVDSRDRLSVSERVSIVIV
jgi:hypothetical protein